MPAGKHAKEMIAFLLLLEHTIWKPWQREISVYGLKIKFTKINQYFLNFIIKKYEIQIKHVFVL